MHISLLHAGAIAEITVTSIALLQPPSLLRKLQ